MKIYPKTPRNFACQSDFKNALNQDSDSFSQEDRYIAHNYRIEKIRLDTSLIDSPKINKANSSKITSPLNQKRSSMSPIKMLKQIIPSQFNNDFSSSFKNKRNSYSPNRRFNLKLQHNVKEKWNKLKGLVKGSHRFMTMAKEIQLYGNPIFLKDESQYLQLLHRTGKAKTTKNYCFEDLPREYLILYPDSIFQIIWSIILFGLILYVLMLPPIRLAFLQKESMDAWGIIQLIVDFMLILDIGITCCTPLYDKEQNLITSHKIIFISYAHFWLWIDLIACIPFSLISIWSNSRDNINDSSYIEKQNFLIRFCELLKMVGALKLFKNKSQLSLINFLAKVTRMNSSIFYNV